MKIYEDLRRWVKEKWTAQDGSDCGDYKGKGRVKCRPSKKVSKKSPQTWGEMSGSEKKKAVRLKQKAHKKGHQFSSHSTGKTWKGDKYKHRLKKGRNKSLKESLLGFSEFLLLEENKPTNPKLWSKCKAAAKKKFDVYPSAYANLWASKCYKKKRKGKGSGWKRKSE
jgi:hypothetical protein